MPIRLRIALATAAIMAVSLLILGAGMYVTQSRTLNDDIRQRLLGVYGGYQENSGRLITGQAVLPPTEPMASLGAYIQILRPNGVIAQRSENLGDAELPISASTLARNARGESVMVDTNVNDQPIRMLSGAIFDARGNLIAFVQVAEPLRPLNESLANLRHNLILSSVIATVVLGLGAWLVGDAAMRPLARMSATARAIGRTGDLSRRLQPPKTRDEVQQLAETFNDMLARLEETFVAQRRFVADASHELRTPLTALRANTDIMLRQVESGMLDRDDLQEGLTDAGSEVDRLSRLVQNLLTLARADVGWRPEMEAVDLVHAARDAARIATPLNRGQQFELALPPPESLTGETDLDVLGNADQLTQLILILLDNAFTHTPAGSEVELRLERAGDAAQLAVRDTGPGIAPEQVQRIFERFYRTDDARARSSGGTGLGLSIAKWIVSIHDGSIAVDSVMGRGTTLTVRIPLLHPGATDVRQAADTRTAPVA